MQLTPNYYNDRVCLNVLANSIDNAKAIYEAAQTYVVVGILSKNYANNEAAIADMKKYVVAIDNAISIGLGAGDPNQSMMVSEISAILQPQHINQVFTGVATSRALLGQKESIINGLVSPTGKVGLVNIATGPLSSKSPAAIVPVETAIALLKDMGGSSIKYFPMGGLKHKDEFAYVAKCCAEHDFYLEPTGSIDLDNYETVLKIALDAGVKKIIPHIYSSIIDKATGATRTNDVKQLLAITQKLVG
ncbi:2-dehydro-3-deoxyphosphooctonate aldolase [Gilliamella sp. HK2]|uniref:2-dehydro-3-deoxy-phosphogluconate aldolase n=1 Tax=unclassified Gilliamella TaxID=2685620 RepID=UPI00080E424F|nr:KDGP aldolase family protein [Gilliamella apicola]OCG26513.1 2-dehydro-3-deoxyphosphooctonate aldolase [Gilliamella apicola]OCG29037.1 2-dehydro-3-deoxyphosphooctonate aldolase [Gilliamella apicola]